MKFLVVCSLLLLFAVTVYCQTTGETTMPPTTVVTTEVTTHSAAGQFQPLTLLVLLPALLFSLL